MNNKMKLHEAIVFAARAHDGQKRKGTDIPYISHPMEVMQILAQIDPYDYDLQIAGLLHDVVEDTDVSINEIGERFGSHVAAMVDAHSHSKDGKWLVRKMREVEEVSQMPLAVKAVVMADKVSNLRSIRNDIDEIGDKVWERFNAPKNLQHIYYSAIQDALLEMKDYVETRDIYWEMVALHKDVFVNFLLDEKRGMIWQISPTENYVFIRENLEWIMPYFEPGSDAVKISRIEAEDIEDLWKVKGVKVDE